MKEMTDSTINHDQPKSIISRGHRSNISNIRRHHHKHKMTCMVALACTSPRPHSNTLNTRKGHICRDQPLQLNQSPSTKIKARHNLRKASMTMTGLALQRNKGDRAKVQECCRSRSVNLSTPTTTSMAQRITKAAQVLLGKSWISSADVEEQEWMITDDLKSRG